MKPIASTDRLVRNLHREAWRPFESNGVGFEGLSHIPLDDSRPPGAGFYLLKLEPGATSLGHEHSVDEYFYMLDGELIDNDGTRYVEGDMVLLRAGTQHSSHSPGGCTVLVFVDKLEKPLEY